MSAERALLGRMVLGCLLGLLLGLLTGDDGQTDEYEGASNQPGNSVTPGVDPHEQSQLVVEERQYSGTSSKQDEIYAE